VFLSFQYRLYPLPNQLDTLDPHLGELNFLGNFAPAQRRDAWELRREPVSYLDQQAQLRRGRAYDSEGLGRLSYDVARDTLQRLDLAFRAFFRRVRAGERPGFPRFRRATGSFTFVPKSRPIQPAANGTRRLHVPRIGEVPIRLHRALPPDAVVKSVTVRTETGEWYATLALEIPDPPPPTELPKRAVGIDLGVTHLATLSDGTKVPVPETPLREERRLRRFQRDLSRKCRGSRRYARRKDRVAKLRRRIRRRRQWLLHQHSHDWAETFDLVCFEDLDAAELIEGNPLARPLTEAGWGAVREMTEYKLALRSGRCLRVPSAGTTQACSSCGRRADPPLGLGERRFACPCGSTMDRDENAARNVLARGWTLLHEELRPSTSEVKREEGGPPPARVGRRAYLRRRVAPGSREVSPDWPKSGLSHISCLN